MNRMDLMRTLLSDMELLNLFVFTKRDMEKKFPIETDKAMGKSLQRMVKDQLLIKAAWGIYVYAPALMRNRGRIIESVARALRPGQLSYVSLESMLSAYGIISQVP